MKKEEFYRKYANTPLSKRDVPLPESGTAKLTLSQIYFMVKANDDKIKEFEEGTRSLIELAAPVLI